MYVIDLHQTKPFFLKSQTMEWIVYYQIYKTRMAKINLKFFGLSENYFQNFGASISAPFRAVKISKDESYD